MQNDNSFYNLVDNKVIVANNCLKIQKFKDTDLLYEGNIKNGMLKYVSTYYDEENNSI
jgi:hypothetical protein